MKLFKVETGDRRFQGIVLYTDEIEGNKYTLLSPDTPVIVLSEKQTRKHFSDSPFLIDWAFVLSPKGFGWVWKMYLEEIE